MSGAEGGVTTEGTPDLTFPAADAEGELNTDSSSLQQDSVSSELTTSKELKEKEEEKKEEAVQKVKSAFIISGVIVAVIGAIFAVTKKLKPLTWLG